MIPIETPMLWLPIEPAPRAVHDELVVSDKIKRAKRNKKTIPLEKF